MRLLALLLLFSLFSFAESGTHEDSRQSPRGINTNHRPTVNVRRGPAVLSRALEVESTTVSENARAALEFTDRKSSRSYDPSSKYVYFSYKLGGKSYAFRIKAEEVERGVSYHLPQEKAGGHVIIQVYPSAEPAVVAELARTPLGAALPTALEVPN